MSSNATPERCVDHDEAWSLDKRKQMMRQLVGLMAKAGKLHRIEAPQYAKTYGVKTCEVEAEMTKHLSEGEGK